MTSLFTRTCRVLILCLLFAAGAAYQSLAGNASTVAITYGEQDRATSYTASSGDCSITWIAYYGGPNQGMIKHSPRCGASIAEQAALMKQLGEALYIHDKDAGTFRTLFWGGLEAESRPASQDLQLRLVLAAHRSQGWDATKGTPFKGDTNGFVRDLANSEHLFGKLQEVFRPYGKEIAVAVVEKVRVMEAGKLPFFKELQEQGIKAADRLPFDCMVWLSLKDLIPMKRIE